LLLGLLEIYRRSQWLIFRTENEYFQNIKLRREITETQGQPWPSFLPPSIEELKVNGATNSLLDANAVTLAASMNPGRYFSGTDTEGSATYF
jgi:hypothetical protein